MKTEIERAKESIKEYRKGYGQSQLPTDCIIQLMMGHAKSEQLLIHSVVVPKGTLCQTPKQCETSYYHQIGDYYCKKCNKTGLE